MHSEDPAQQDACSTLLQSTNRARTNIASVYSSATHDGRVTCPPCIPHRPARRRAAPSVPTGGLARKFWSQIRVVRKLYWPPRRHTTKNARQRPPPTRAPPHPRATNTSPRDTAGPVAQAQTRHAGARNVHTHPRGIPAGDTRTPPHETMREPAGPMAKEPADLRIEKRGCKRLSRLKGFRPFSLSSL